MQVGGLYRPVCKSVGVAYPGSNPGSATGKTASLRPAETLAEASSFAPIRRPRDGSGRALRRDYSGCALPGLLVASPDGRYQQRRGLVSGSPASLGADQVQRSLAFHGCSRHIRAQVPAHTASRGCRRDQPIGLGEAELLVVRWAKCVKFIMSRSKQAGCHTADVWQPAWLVSNLTTVLFGIERQFAC